jgi:hypothetical protein
VKTAYLQSHLEEPVYMRMPDGLERRSPNGKPMCLLLKRSLYGLKQSANNWNRCIDGWFRSRGFIPSGADPCLYIRRDKRSEINMIVCLYVDDLMIAGPGDKEISAFKRDITKSFDMKDLGALKYLLGMEISFRGGAVHISQRKYVEEMLEIYGMQDCKPQKTPAEDKQRLTRAQEAKTDEHRQEMKNVRYRHAVGHLIYVASVTRFDIANAVREAARFMENPGPEHWGAVKRILRYLQGSKETELVLGPFPRGDLRLVGYSDSDWAGDSDTRRSTTGYVFVLADAAGVIRSGAISTNCRLQPTVALSSSEAEYMAVCSAAVEAIYLRSLFNDLGYQQTAPTVIYEDNQAAIALANSALGQWHSRTRHVDVRYKFVKERVRSLEIQLVYVNTADQLADICTKNLGTTQFLRLKARLMGQELQRGSK